MGKINWVEKAGRETKGPGEAKEGKSSSWRTGSTRKAPGHPPHCVGVSECLPVPREGSELLWSLAYFSLLTPAFL